MMSSNQEQLVLLWRCLGCGVWTDLFLILTNRLIRRSLCSKAARFISDIVLAVLVGFGVFLFALAADGGELRGVMLLSMTVGAAVCHLSFGRVFGAILDRFCRVFTSVDALLEEGLRKTAVLWRKIRKKVELFCKKHLQSKHKRVYNRND